MAAEVEDVSYIMVDGYEINPELAFYQGRQLVWPRLVQEGASRLHSLHHN